MSPKIKVRVVAYKGHIVIAPKNPEQGIIGKGKKLWWPTGGTNGNNLGCVLGDTKNQLGVSPEALHLMHQVRRNRDAVGDLGWWRCDDNTYAFAWWGPIYRIVNPEIDEGDRDFHVHETQCHKIANRVPALAKKVIDNYKADEEDIPSWNEPMSLVYDSKYEED